jgi:hypothetical protein
MAGGALGHTLGIARQLIWLCTWLRGRALDYENLHAYVCGVTEADVRAVLAERVKTTGGTAAFAKANGLSQTYVQMAMRRDRTLGPKVLKALGIRKNTTYEWIPR